MKPTDQYHKVGVQTDVASADPHRLIVLLLVGAITQVTRARASAERGDLEAKGIAVNAAVDIISTLLAALDQERGGEVAENLERLYNYMLETLAVAHANNDLKGFEEVVTLLKTIKEGWDGIREEALKALGQNGESGNPVTR